MNIFEIEKLPSIKEDEIINILKENEKNLIFHATYKENSITFLIFF